MSPAAHAFVKVAPMRGVVSESRLHFLTNSGLTSIVLCTWLFSAAQRSCTAVAPLPASCARFWLKRSLSSLSSFSFLFMAPGRDFKLLRCILACPISTCPSTPSSISGSALVSDSRSATSFLLGRRRFWILDDVFSILDTKDECLIFCLSFLDEAKAVSKSSGLGRVAWVGRVVRADFARAVVRFFIGA